VRRFANKQKEEAATTTDFTDVQLSYAEEHSELKKKTAQLNQSQVINNDHPNIELYQNMRERTN